MKLEDQVISLPLAKRLKELGVKQDAHFWWCHDEEINDWNINTSYGIDVGWHKKYCAFTVAELGEMLPKCQYASVASESQWIMWEWDSKSGRYVPTEMTAPTEADARAKMLIYLIEKGMVKP